MSRTDLKTWMRVKNKTAVDIAARLKIDPVTVKRFLAGKNIRPIIYNAMLAMIAEDPLPQSDQKKVSN